MSNSTVAYVAPFLESIKLRHLPNPNLSRLHGAIEGVLLDAAADGVEWGTELKNTTETLVDVVREWLHES
jgi:hypothetical protein